MQDFSREQRTISQQARGLHRRQDTFNNHWKKALYRTELIVMLANNDSETKLDTLDPFVCFLLYGGYLYFNHEYDIVAVNSVCFDEVPPDQNPSALYFGPPEPLPPLSIEAILEVTESTPTHTHFACHILTMRFNQARRFMPVTSRRLTTLGYTHFAWVCASGIADC